MRRYLLRRILLVIVTLIGVTIIIFVASRLSGDVALLLAPQEATDEEIQDIRVELGLDKPIPVQYIIFVKDAVRGEFGQSIRYHRPVMEVILSRVPGTVELVGVAFIFSILSGVLLGTISATRRDSWMDLSGKLFALLGQSMPGFWIGIMASCCCFIKRLAFFQA